MRLALMACHSRNWLSSSIHSSQFMVRNPIVIWYGPYLKGRYGRGSVLYTSQFGYDAAAGRLKSTGVHTPGGRSGDLNEVPPLNRVFSRPGEPARGDVDLDRLSAAATRNQVMLEKSRTAYKTIFGRSAIEAIMPPTLCTVFEAIIVRSTVVLLFSSKLSSKHL